MRLTVDISSCFKQFINAVLKFFLEVFIFDKQIRRILKGKIAKIFIKKYVNKVNKIYVKSPEETKENPHIIWQYWGQGIKNAPDIVLRCTESVEKYKGENKHIILDDDNIEEYIKIPERILELNKKGLIVPANYSDYIRVALLAKYGGVWLDSTVFLTDKLPPCVFNSDLFVFQNDLRIDLDGLNFASYFMAAKPDNELVLKAKMFLETFWENNRFAYNYFFYLHAFTMLSQSNKEMKKEFSKIPYFSFIPVQRFQKELFDPYSKERYDEIKSISSVHKLSYKAHVLNKNKRNFEGTFYEKLINKELD